MFHQYLDFLVDKNLGGDKSRVVELFQDDSVFEELNKNSSSYDWFHFEPKTLDGDYFIKAKNGYRCFMQERGQLVSCVEKFPNIEDAAKHFFETAGYY